MGYDVSVLSDGIGDRDIPGATAKQLVDVSTNIVHFVLFISPLFIIGGEMWWLKKRLGFLLHCSVVNDGS